MKFTNAAIDETLVESGKTMTDPNRKMILYAKQKFQGILLFFAKPAAVFLRNARSSHHCTGLLQPLLCCFLDTARVRDGEQGGWIQIRTAA